MSALMWIPNGYLGAPMVIRWFIVSAQEYVLLMRARRMVVAAHLTVRTYMS